MAKKAKRKSPAKSHHKKRMSDPGKKTGRKKGKARRKKGMGEVFTHAGAKRGFKSMGVGALGGVIAKGVDLFMPDGAEVMKGVVTLGASFIAGAMENPNLSAGLAGGWGYGFADRMAKKMGLADDFENTDYTEEDAMSEYPDALTEDGKALYLAEDGNLYLSDDFYKQPDGTFVLADAASPYNASLAVANY